MTPLEVLEDYEKVLSSQNSLRNKILSGDSITAQGFLSATDETLSEHEIIRCYIALIIAFPEAPCFTLWNALEVSQQFLTRNGVEDALLARIEQLIAVKVCEDGIAITIAAKTLEKMRTLEIEKIIFLAIIGATINYVLSKAVRAIMSET